MSYVQQQLQVSLIHEANETLTVDQLGSDTIESSTDRRKQVRDSPRAPGKAGVLNENPHQAECLSQHPSPGQNGYVLHRVQEH